jgi:hypothetical protein
VWILNDIYVAEDPPQLVADNLIRKRRKWPRKPTPCACACPPAATTKCAQNLRIHGLSEDTEFKNYILPISED